MVGITVDAGWIVGCTIVWLVSQLITAAVSAVIALRVQRRDIEALSAAVKTLFDNRDAHERRLDALNGQRAACELRAAQTYATREELIHVIGETAANHRVILNEIKELAEAYRQSVGKVHSRVDDAVNRIARLEGMTNEG